MFLIPFNLNYPTDIRYFTNRKRELTWFEEGEEFFSQTSNIQHNCIESASCARLGGVCKSAHANVPLYLDTVYCDKNVCLLNWL